MREIVASAHYLQIALDLSGRIAKGEFPEKTRLYGRSVLASEYNVSPETIRRALRLLADMKVVEVKPQSGAVVLSVDSAQRYIDRFSENADIAALRNQLRDQIVQMAELQSKLVETATALLKTQSGFAAAGAPLPNYEVTVPVDSPLIGQSIGALRFWQSTGSTIVAIRRGPHMILSPGPYAQLFRGDILVLVGTYEAVEAARRLVTAKE